ncbi:efflux RND transporter periplasmic adaptor subunit [Alteromonas oceanisediminis]|uniref:efflux RND transporter periplasmic adaptor subunit n=1 Tax=Alteromonas oceanisediminis TaxID=2836180 RepID=UPI001BDABDD1|nr:efflux RND transporter periplasmic adaptor subunit [Alteromonas oceanisediminis]MBT0585141.1 efflux RND transporter periplasmic adaptor subunit [Alteromonas oceanisediminis]
MRSGILLLVILQLIACSEHSAQQASNYNQDQPPVVDWQWLQPVASAQERATGTTRVARQAVLSFEQNGRITYLFDDVGAPVERGDVLGKLLTTQAELDVDIAQSRLLEAGAGLVEAEKTYARLQNLFTSGAVSQSELDAGLLRLRASLSQKRSAESRLAQARKLLDDHVLVAPYDGVVTARLMEPDQQTSAGAPVLHFQGNAENMEVVALVAEAVRPALQLGSRHVAKVPALSDARLNVRLIELSDDTQQRGLYTAVFQFEDPDIAPISGLSTELLLSTETTDPARFLPLGSFVLSEQGNAVFFEISPFANDTEQRMAVRHDASVIAHQEQGIVIRSDLSVNTAIVSRGASFLQHKQMVKPINYPHRLLHP